MNELFDQVMNFVLLLPAWQQIGLGIVTTYFGINLGTKIYRVVHGVVSGTVKTTRAVYSVTTWPFRKVMGIRKVPTKINGWVDVIAIYDLLRTNKAHLISTDVLKTFVLATKSVPMIDTNSKYTVRNLGHYLVPVNPSKPQGKTQLNIGPVSRALSELHFRGEKTDTMV